MQENIIYHTTELTFVVRPDNIIEMGTNVNFKGTYSLDSVEENLKVLEKAIAGKRKATLLHFPDVYVKKEVLKKYSNSDVQTIATALLAKSFASKLVGNLFLSLHGRFNEKLKDRPIKVFTKQEMAVEWLLGHLANAK